MFLRLLCLALAALCSLPVAVRAEDDPVGARKLFLSGRYDEARIAYAQLAPRTPALSAIGVARCQEAVGALTDALATLAKIDPRDPGAPAVAAERARLELERGGWDAAQAQVDAALGRDPDQPLARWILAELHRVHGRLDEANDGYRWFVRYYNAHQDSLADPETMRWIGLAAAHYARWNRNSGQFHFLVNTLYPDALKLDKAYWPANYEAARLFIEKYNRATATSELDAALAINPRAAEVHAARAMIALQEFELDSATTAVDRALAINPRLVLAHQLRADVIMLASGPAAAIPVLEHARTLDPMNEETLGRLAAMYGAADGRVDSAGTRMGAVMAEVEKRNPRCGAFFASMASSLDLLQRLTEAARYYEEARRRMPQLVAVPGQLGLVQLRLGDETRGRVSLDDAFKADPFNKRVKNSIDVLEVLNGYATLETAHFVLRYDRRDSVLARHASDWLESDVYPDVVKTFGYAPPAKTLLEIFRDHGGKSGHSWFSSRLVGMPYIGTVGGCPGRMFAIASPNEPGIRFNWARVLKHEFVHVVNLAQTDFSIPRWFTEGLAVANEGAGKPREWSSILARRAAADRLFDLETIQRGFTRPSSGDDWALAYCQAELYVRYMTEAYGKDGPRKMIAAYGEHLATGPAIKKAFGVSREAFEKGYRDYVKRIAPPRTTTPETESVTALEKKARDNPKDAGVLARLAKANFDLGRRNEAREWASKALAIEPKNGLAVSIVAQGLIAQGDKAGALELLSAAFDPSAPQLDALVLLTNLTLEKKDYPELERFSSIGDQKFPYDANWLNGLSIALRETQQKGKLTTVLERRADGDSDDIEIRLELAKLAQERKDPESASRWARSVLHIDVMNADANAILAASQASRAKKPGQP